MEGDGRSQDKMLDVEYIQNKLDEGYKYTEEAEGRDLILVVGNTGVGKSTTCNYLLGHRMIPTKYNGRPVVETVEVSDLQIGHQVSAETLYAKSILLNDAQVLGAGNSNICLVDCPGFLGNRTCEESVIESVSTELAIRNAHQVKGVLILVSFTGFQDPRLTEIRQLIKTLISLFKDPIEMVQHSIFVITKKYKGMSREDASEETIGALNSLKDHCQHKATWLYKNQNVTSSEGLSYSEYDKIATYFSALLQRKDYIIFIDPLDHGESKTLIFDRINGIKPRRGYWKQIKDAAKQTVGLETDKPIQPITIDDFNFSQYDAHRCSFNKALYDRAHDGHKLLSKIRDCHEINQNLHSEISNYRARLVSLKKLQTHLKEDRTDRDKGYSQHAIDIESITILETIIDENDKSIEFKRNEISRIGKSLGKLSEELKSINTEQHILFREKSVHRIVHCLNVFGWEEMEFCADTGSKGVPIVDVYKTMQNGNWVEEVDRRKEGKYDIKYQSSYGARPASATVRAFIRKKDEKGNKIRIQQINDETVSLTNKKKVMENEVGDLKHKNEGLEFTVKQAKSSREDYEKNLSQRLVECEEEIDRRNSQIIQMQEDGERARVAGLQYLQEFDESVPKFEILVKIAKLLQFPSALITGFISQYQKFLSDRLEYNFDGSNVNSVDPKKETLEKENENILDLKDPITGNEIKNLVATPAGTLFDENSLFKQFDDGRSKSFSFKRKDGSVEEIKYLGWMKIPDIQSYLDKQQNEKFYSRGSSTSTPLFTQPDIDQMAVCELEAQRDELLQEIRAIKTQLEVKETELGKVYRQLGKRQLNSEKEVMLSEVTEGTEQPNTESSNADVKSSHSPGTQSEASVSLTSLSTTGIYTDDEQGTIDQSATELLESDFCHLTLDDVKETIAKEFASSDKLLF